ncbi:MAG: hypothetical protein LBQ24_06270 [Candidatus Peribacteria bacterium]|nr:hypothetical protein [Candidatus Peribacteria bacterium]
MFNFTLSSDTNKLFICMEVFPPSLVTLQSHHSTIAIASFDVVVTISFISNFFLSFFFRVSSFN